MGWGDGFLSLARDDRVAGLCIGLVFVGTIATIINGLTLLRDDHEVPPTEPKPQYITQDTEDALMIGTLETLVSHTNYSIREVAIKILCDRAVNDPDAITILLYGLSRPDYEHRMKSIRALAFLLKETGGPEGFEKLHNAKAYSAIVRSLELCLQDHPLLQVDDPRWDEYYVRDMAERLCLTFVFELASKYKADMLIKARFVEKWLSKQQWGATTEERQENFRNYIHNKTNKITDIVELIKDSPRGLHVLEQVGLIKKVSSEWQPYLASKAAQRLSQDEDWNTPEPRGSQTTRPREHSEEEQRLRRQHREAMVLNDGSRPLGRDDIIERGNTFSS